MSASLTLAHCNRQSEIICFGFVKFESEPLSFNFDATSDVQECRVHVANSASVEPRNGNRKLGKKLLLSWPCDISSW